MPDDDTDAADDDDPADVGSVALVAAPEGVLYCMNRQNGAGDAMGGCCNTSPPVAAAPLCDEPIITEKAPLPPLPPGGDAVAPSIGGLSKGACPRSGV